MKMQLNTLAELASLLESERKRQKLTRAQAAAVCNVSPSFIRDAETQPERCTFGKLVQLVNGLGLAMSLTGRPGDASTGIVAEAMRDTSSGRTADASRLPTGGGIINSARRENK